MMMSYVSVFSSTVKRALEIYKTGYRAENRELGIPTRDVTILHPVLVRTNYSTPHDFKCHMTKLLTVVIAIYWISIIIVYKNRVNLTILHHAACSLIILQHPPKSKHAFFGVLMFFVCLSVCKTPPHRKAITFHINVCVEIA